jgi:hypothetical protein
VCHRHGVDLAVQAIPSDPAGFRAARHRGRLRPGHCPAP